MPHRNDLHLSSLFDPTFYECKAVPEISLPFPLPASEDTLAAFLSSESKEGLQYKKGVTELLDKLSQWAERHGINTDNFCQHLRSKLVDYSGSNAEINHIQFPLYKQGIPQLFGIVVLLEKEEISIEHRVNTIMNLMQGIDVCAPGAFTNITDAYWKLNSHLSIGIEWMVARRTIAEQVALIALKKGIQNLELSSNNLVGMEIHFINALLNQYAEALSIKPIEDDYIRHCEGNALLTELLTEFSNEIARHLTPEAIINQIMSQHPLENALWESNERMEAFEMSLDRYGEDPQFATSQLANAIIGASCTSKWDCEYSLFLTLSIRIIQSRYFDDIACQIYILPTNEALVFFSSNHSLKFASVTLSRERFPLIPYFVEALQEEKPEFQALVDMVLLPQFTDEQRVELIMGMVGFLQATHCTLHPEPEENNKKISQWIFLILRLNPNNLRFDLILLKLPKAAQKIYLDKLGLDRLKEVIQSSSQLINLLEILSDEEKRQLLQGIDIGKLASLIKTGTQLAEALRVSPEQQWPLFYPVKKRIFLDDEHTSALLKIIFIRFPVSEWDTRCRPFFPEGWRDAITHLTQLCYLVIELPDDKAKALLLSVSPKQQEAISYQRTLFFQRSYDFQALMAFFQKASKEKIMLFLSLFDNRIIRKAWDCYVTIAFTINNLADEKSEMLLGALGKPYITSLFKGNQFGAMMILATLKKCEQVFKYLAIESVMQLNYFQLAFFLNRISAAKAKALLTFLGTIGLKKILREPLALFFLIIIPEESSQYSISLLGTDYIKNTMSFSVLLTGFAMLPKTPEEACKWLKKGDFEEITNKYSLEVVLELLGPELIKFIWHAYFLDFAVNKIQKHKRELEPSLREVDDMLTDGHKHQYGRDAILRFMDEPAYRRLQTQWIHFIYHVTYMPQEVLSAFLNTIPPEELSIMIRAIAQLSPKDLHTLFDKKSLDENLAFVRNIADPQWREVLLLAVFRGYREGHRPSPFANLMFWQRERQEKESHVYTLFETALLKNIETYPERAGFAFLDQVLGDPEIAALFQQGDLAKFLGVLSPVIQSMRGSVSTPLPSLR